MIDKNKTPEESTLGKKVEYASEYDPNLLFPIPRQAKRSEIGVDDKNLPFNGVDIWNGYEISWLNSKGKPNVAIGVFIIPCSTPNLIESKSFKLYLNSFNQTKFESREQVQGIIKTDLSKVLGKELEVKLYSVEEFDKIESGRFNGICLDDLDIEVTEYTLNTDYLMAKEDEQVEETLYTHLLKSNCLVTGQPDWASLLIKYTGPKINHEGLLKYVISLRQHNEFHEQCVERIFSDLTKKCGSQKLTVYARYTRRGGLDINPFRSNFEDEFENKKFSRQ